jgi:threonine/homoserine/homoserine lactone efflux protein
MDLWLVGRSVLIGLAVAAPVGPMSLLCIQRTLAVGQSAGLVFGAGIAAGDLTYAAVAAFGVTAISAALLTGTLWIKLIGSLVLAYLGIRIARSRPDTAAKASPSSSGFHAFLTAYGLTITNPPTILFFASIFASIASLTSVAQSLAFSGGVFVGSMLWWVLLTALVAKAANRLKPPTMLWINRVSGLVLIGFAAYGFATMVA